MVRRRAVLAARALVLQVGGALCIFMMLGAAVGMGSRQPRRADDAALLTAARRGDAAQIRALLRRGANPNARSEDGWTPFMVAVVDHHMECAQVLLGSGAKVNASDRYGETVLLTLARTADTQAMRYLLMHGANPNLAGLRGSSRGSTALSVAAYLGNEEMVRLLLGHNARVNNRDGSGSTPLIEAVVRSCDGRHPREDAARLRTFRMLLRSGAHVNARRKNGMTALMVAADAENTEMVIELLKAHANVRARDNRGRTALYYAMHGYKAQHGKPSKALVAIIKRAIQR